MILAWGHGITKGLYETMVIAVCDGRKKKLVWSFLFEIFGVASAFCFAYFGHLGLKKKTRIRYTNEAAIRDRKNAQWTEQNPKSQAFYSTYNPPCLFLWMCLCRSDESPEFAAFI